jgi:hypothetical protein
METIVKRRTVVSRTTIPLTTPFKTSGIPRQAPDALIGERKTCAKIQLTEPDLIIVNVPILP